MKWIIGLILANFLGIPSVMAVSLPQSENFETQIPIEINSFTCEVFYESYYSETSYFNPELLSTLGEGMRHFYATYLDRSPRSYFRHCDLHREILEDAEAHGGMVAVDVAITRYESRTIVGCEGGSWGGCHSPIYQWVPATEVVLTFQNGLKLSSRGCGAILGCRD